MLVALWTGAGARKEESPYKRVVLLAQSGRRKVEVEMIGLVLLTVLGAAGRLHRPHDFSDAQTRVRQNPIEMMR